MNSLVKTYNSLDDFESGMVKEKMHGWKVAHDKMGDAKVVIRITVTYEKAFPATKSSSERAAEAQASIQQIRRARHADQAQQVQISQQAAMARIRAEAEQAEQAEQSRIRAQAEQAKQARIRAERSRDAEETRLAQMRAETARLAQINEDARLARMYADQAKLSMPRTILRHEVLGDLIHHYYERPSSSSRSSANDSEIVGYVTDIDGTGKVHKKRGCHNAYEPITRKEKNQQKGTFCDRCK